MQTKTLPVKKLSLDQKLPVTSCLLEMQESRWQRRRRGSLFSLQISSETQSQGRQAGAGKTDLRQSLPSYNCRQESSPISAEQLGKERNLGLFAIQTSILLGGGSGGGRIAPMTGLAEGSCPLQDLGRAPLEQEQPGHSWVLVPFHQSLGLQGQL